MAAYPLGLWGGYTLGDKYIDLPGRIDTQQKFALGFGILGFFTPFLYFENANKNEEAIIRLGLGQSVALATAGHFLAGHYRTGENIPDGVNTGIMDHTALGVGLGLTVAAMFNAVTPGRGSLPVFWAAPWAAWKGYGITATATTAKSAGFTTPWADWPAVLWAGASPSWLYNSEDSPHRKKVLITSLLAGGALVGYSLTNLLTFGMEDRGAQRADSWTDGLAVNLMPMPQPVVRETGIPGPAGVERKIDLRYHVQAVSYRF